MAADLIERRVLNSGPSTDRAELLQEICDSLGERGTRWLRATFTESDELIATQLYERDRDL